MVLICLSLVANDVEHLLMCLLAIHVFSFVKVLLKGFCTLPLFYWLFAFLLLTWGSSVKFLLQVVQFPYREHIHEELCTRVLVKLTTILLRRANLLSGRCAKMYSSQPEEVSKRCPCFFMTSLYLYPVFLSHQTWNRRQAMSLDVRQIWVQTPCQPSTHTSMSNLSVRFLLHKMDKPTLRVVLRIKSYVHVGQRMQ